MTQPHEAIRNLRDAVENRVDVDQLLVDILAEWNGTSGLAKSLKDVFDASNDGSQTQARILSDVMRLVHARTGSGDDGSESEEELEALGRALLTDDEADAD